MFTTVTIFLLLSAWNVECANTFPLDEVQSVAVRGTLLCGKVPMVDVHLKLYDVDRIDPDDLMATGFTDENGDFYIEGHEIEMTNIDPVLKIYHKCNDEGLPCDRKWKIGIPDKYITHNNRTPQFIMDLGVMNAEVEIDGETRDCFH
uniref:Transthyretin-like protein 46 n=1 Tax=Steinernema glaseri TaxID=37863 RepID=A0A1I7Z3X2_9BILA